MDTRQTTDSVITNLYRAQSPAAANMPSLDNQLSVMTQEMRTDENYFSKVESISTTRYCSFTLSVVRRVLYFMTAVL